MPLCTTLLHHLNFAVPAALGVSRYASAVGADDPLEEDDPRTARAMMFRTYADDDLDSPAVTPRGSSHRGSDAKSHSSKGRASSKADATVDASAPAIVQRAVVRALPAAVLIVGCVSPTARAALAAGSTVGLACVVATPTLGLVALACFLLRPGRWLVVAGALVGQDVAAGVVFEVLRGTSKWAAAIAAAVLALQLLPLVVMTCKVRVCGESGSTRAWYARASCLVRIRAFTNFVRTRIAGIELL